jgi:hypothetical protein
MLSKVPIVLTIDIGRPQELKSILLLLSILAGVATDER